MLFIKVNRAAEKNNYRTLYIIYAIYVCTSITCSHINLYYIYIKSVNTVTFACALSRLYKNHIPKMTKMENINEKLQHTLVGIETSHAFSVCFCSHFFFIENRKKYRPVKRIFALHVECASVYINISVYCTHIHEHIPADKFIVHFCYPSNGYTGRIQ